MLPFDHFSEVNFLKNRDRHCWKPDRHGHRVREKNSRDADYPGGISAITEKIRNEDDRPGIGVAEIG